MPRIARSTKTPDPIPAPLSEWLADLGLTTTTLNPQYPLDELNGHHVQNRDEDNVAPLGNVRIMREALKAGVKFQPIIVTKDKTLVDGNTRKTASLQNDVHFFPAYEVDAVYGDGESVDAGKLRALAAKANVTNGEPLTQAERFEHCKALIREGWTDQRIASWLGLTTGTIARARRQVEGAEFVAESGLDPRAFSLPLLGALGRYGQNINDEPFTELAKLTDEAGLGVAEVRDLAKGIIDAGSDVKAMEYVAREREKRDGRIRAKTNGGSKGGHTTVAPAVQARRNIGFFRKFAADPAALVDRTLTKEECEAYAADWEMLVALGTRVVEMQHRACG